jgi:hypothetical protein
VVLNVNYQIWKSARSDDLEIFAKMHGTDPDIAEPDRVLMILQLNEDFGRMGRRIFGG